MIRPPPNPPLFPSPPFSRPRRAHRRGVGAGGCPRQPARAACPSRPSAARARAPGAGAGSLSRGLCRPAAPLGPGRRSEEHTSELQSQSNLVCRLLLETKKTLRFSTLRVLTASTSESFRTTIFLLTPLGVCCRRLCGQGSLHFYCRLMLHLMGVQTSPY